MAEEHSVAVPYLFETLAFLLTVVIVVPLCKKLRISPIIGFLAVGAITGPHAIALVDDVEAVQHVAELGVIFLLFTIGLELSFERLAAFAKQIFGLGTVHFLLCATVLSFCAWFWDNSAEASIILGCCLALSSTAVVMQLLTEKGEIASSHGRSVFSVLLFQDLMVVPLLILVTIFGAHSDASIGSIVVRALLKAVVAIAAIIVVGRYLLRYLLRLAARTRTVEVFMAATLLAVLFTATLTGISGLSMALGAFLAGVLLAETEFKHQIETDIEPFKGLFLGLFFTGVGMNIDFLLAVEKSWWVLSAVIGLLWIKAAMGLLAGLIFRMKFSASLRTSLLLAEAGEFAFLVIGQASLNYDIVDVEVGQFLVVVAGISMALTPVLAWLSQQLGKQLEKRGKSQSFECHAEDEHDHIIIAGFGRVGHAVANILNSQSIPFVALDTDPETVAAHHHYFDEPVYHGDASNKELLKRAGVDRARAVVLTMDNARAVLKTLKVIRSEWPDLPVIVRARNDEHSAELFAAGASKVVPELLESSLQIAGHVLCAWNFSKDEAEACLELVRRHNYEELQDQEPSAASAKNS
ncbi:monovalent cation:proton antiporter-2 (CPA2) family protein [Agaribacterium haliotis]|uniref:monovalent cation:proton antiporter-2 (CPA2) family protein n=1 Tax=Agaribacterium haliotis TaxID=2013869 RepID=UPI000BB57BD1|nr:monovalent cation:proton antiporter-2 (CPA2) family protein [Agaribacterium haliotis]